MSTYFYSNAIWLQSGPKMSTLGISKFNTHIQDQSSLNLVFLLRKYILKTPSVQWLLRRRVSIIQTDVSDGMVYLMKLKQTMKMAQGTLDGAAQNFERLSVKTLCEDVFFISCHYSILHNNTIKNDRSSIFTFGRSQRPMTEKFQVFGRIPKPKQNDESFLNCLICHFNFDNPFLMKPSKKS